MIIAHIVVKINKKCNYDVDNYIKWWYIIYRSDVKVIKRKEEYLIIRHLEIPNKILKDKRIKPEGKLIYSYIYTKGFDRILTDINVGELQQVVRITNKGLEKNLEKLQTYNYLLYQEYDKGMYTINLLG